jgi:GT2 family glycosyltransferase
VSEHRDNDGAALPPLAVVVVNWNGAAVLPACLDSLAAADYPGLRVLLVDNGSGDDSVAWARAHHPDCEVLETGSNLRWAGGNNAGLRRLAEAGFDGHVLLLNNDTVVPAGSLRRLVTALAAAPEAWLATPRITYADEPGLAWYDGGVAGRRCGWIRHEGIRRPLGRLREGTRFVDWGTGCALLLTPRARREVGLLDEGFHFYGEDTDYGLRVRAAGGRILHVPAALIQHRVSASVGGTSPRKLRLRHASHLRLLRKHWPRRTWPLLLPCQLVYLAGHAVWQLWHGRPAAALAVWEGALDGMRGPAPATDLRWTADPDG